MQDSGRRMEAGPTPWALQAPLTLSARRLPSPNPLSWCALTGSTRARLNRDSQKCARSTMALPCSRGGAPVKYRCCAVLHALVMNASLTLRDGSCIAMPASYRVSRGIACDRSRRATQAAAASRAASLGVSARSEGAASSESTHDAACTRLSSDKGSSHPPCSEAPTRSATWVAPGPTGPSSGTQAWLAAFSAAQTRSHAAPSPPPSPLPRQKPCSSTSSTMSPKPLAYVSNSSGSERPTSPRVRKPHARARSSREPATIRSRMGESASAAPSGPKPLAKALTACLHAAASEVLAARSSNCCLPSLGRGSCPSQSIFARTAAAQLGIPSHSSRITAGTLPAKSPMFAEATKASSSAAASWNASLAPSPPSPTRPSMRLSRWSRIRGPCARASARYPKAPCSWLRLPTRLRREALACCSTAASCPGVAKAARSLNTWLSFTSRSCFKASWALAGLGNSMAMLCSLRPISPTAAARVPWLSSPPSAAALRASCRRSRKPRSSAASLAGLASREWSAACSGRLRPEWIVTQWDACCVTESSGGKRSLRTALSRTPALSSASCRYIPRR
mmetsp:Transcript_34469/g.97217  ORF Transcript_34469/g.97217 Transcript_34469/m.97217 type:complete len:565 (-) Transcript_34469:1266-2960(-)